MRDCLRLAVIPGKMAHVPHKRRFDTTMAEQRKPLILVADDQDNMRTTVQRVLKFEGYETVMAANGRAALDILEDRAVDLVLLDINMPIVDGIGVVEEMKANPRLSAVPIVMSTGSMDASHVLRCKVLGVSDYLVKPYKIADLLKRVQMVLGRGKAG